MFRNSPSQIPSIPYLAAGKFTHLTAVLPFMGAHLRIYSPWRQLLVLILVFLPQLFLLSVSLFVGKEGGTTAEADKLTVNTFKVLQATSSVLFFLLPAALFALFTFSAKRAEHLGFKKAQRQNMYVLSILVMVMALPFVFWLGEMNRQIPLPEWMVRLEQNTGDQLTEILKVNNWYDIVVNVIVIALFPAICEEVFFRGALQRVLIHLTRSPWTGIIIAAILFSALHLQFAGFLPRFFLGIVLGFLYWYSGSLWTSILAHFVFNGIQVLWVSYSPQYIENNPQLPYGDLAAVVSGIAIVAILYFYYKQSTVSYEKVFKHHDPYNQFMA
jgi:uncharacterized protein